jgi:AraC-like DNA-binding protein
MPPDANPVQSYRERLPSPAAASHLTSVWVHEVAPSGGAYDHRTVPNGSVELAYELGSDALTVRGPQREPTVERIAPGTAIVGVRFRPGAAAAALGVPASELVSRRVDLDRVWGGGAATLAARLDDAGTAAAAARVLEDEVVRQSSDADAMDPLIRAAVERLQPWRRDDVALWTAGLFISPRQLRRRFVAALGFGPKTLQRLLRFQAFLALTQPHPGEHGGLARLAAEAGYADQAHLTRECTRLTGLSPRAFLDETSRSCGPNHNHEASYSGLRRALIAARTIAAT